MSRMNMSGHVRARSRSESGAAVVEFALILPLLAMLMLGILTFGVTYSNDVALTSAVREGARFGSTLQNDDTDDHEWGTAVVTRTDALSGDNFTELGSDDICAILIEKGSPDIIVDSSVDACESGTSDAGPIPATPADIADGTCVAKVWARVPARLSWFLGSMEIDVYGESVSAYARDLGC